MESRLIRVLKRHNSKVCFLYSFVYIIVIDIPLVNYRHPVKRKQNLDANGKLTPEALRLFNILL